ncbi:MAG: helix-turn-helix domain-containing protein [Kineosporiaceae bacterium]
MVIASVEGEAELPDLLWVLPGAGPLNGPGQRLRDVPVAAVRVVLIRRRFACVEQRCPRRTFAEVTGQVPARARTTARLREQLLTAVLAGRSVAEVAASYGVSWWTVQAVLNAAALLGIDPDAASPRRLGIDEHRYRSRYWRDEHGTWRRQSPGCRRSSTSTPGASSAWSTDAAPPGSLRLAARPQEQDRIEVVAIDPSAAFRGDYVTSSRRRGRCRRVPPGQTRQRHPDRVRQRSPARPRAAAAAGSTRSGTSGDLLLRAGDTLSQPGPAPGDVHRRRPHPGDRRRGR